MLLDKSGNLFKIFQVREISRESSWEARPTWIFLLKNVHISNMTPWFRGCLLTSTERSKVQLKSESIPRKSQPPRIFAKSLSCQSKNLAGFCDYWYFFYFELYQLRQNTMHHSQLFTLWWQVGETDIWYTCALLSERFVWESSAMPLVVIIPWPIDTLVQRFLNRWMVH
jgi:hypothetical protein